jgi:hypothetical protein
MGEGGPEFGILNSGFWILPLFELRSLERSDELDAAAVHQTGNHGDRFALRPGMVDDALNERQERGPIRVASRSPGPARVPAAWVARGTPRTVCHCSHSKCRSRARGPPAPAEPIDVRCDAPGSLALAIRSCHSLLSDDALTRGASWPHGQPAELPFAPGLRLLDRACASVSLPRSSHSYPVRTRLGRLKPERRICVRLPRPRTGWASPT